MELVKAEAALVFGYRTKENVNLQIIDDLKEECSKFGQLLHIVVPRPVDPSQSASLIGQGFYGKVRLLQFPILHRAITSFQQDMERQ